MAQCFLQTIFRTFLKFCSDALQQSYIINKNILEKNMILLIPLRKYVSALNAIPCLAIPVGPVSREVILQA